MDEIPKHEVEENYTSPVTSSPHHSQHFLHSRTPSCHNVYIFRSKYLMYQDSKKDVFLFLDVLKLDTTLKPWRCRQQDPPNVGILPHYYTASQPRRSRLEEKLFFSNMFHT
jgi:hypothetical protein